MLSLIDKLIFGIGLILATQIPQIVDQYAQFLSGFYEATKEQVGAFEGNALRHGYADVDKMIDDLSHNETSVVREDAEQKREAVALLRELEVGREIFKHESFLKKLRYMLNPSRYRFLQKTMEGFTWGVPLSLNSLISGFVGGFILSFIVFLPLRFCLKKRSPTI